MRAVIYGRVSTDMQRGNYSIPSQVAACANYAKGKRLVLVGNRFVNPETGQDAETGTPAYVDDFTSRELSRPALDAMQDYLTVNAVDVVLVYALDRLARDAYIRQTLEREIESLGAKVEYVTGAYDDTAEGEVKKDLDSTFAKWENAKRVERSNRGKMEKAKGGLFVAGRAPYGYIADKTAPGGLRIMPEQANIVVKVFTFYINGMSARAITNWLNDNGIVSPMGNTWGKSTIPKILQNTAYIGYIFYNKHKRTKSGKIVDRDQDQWVRIEGITPIIDEGTFNRVQELMVFNAEHVRRPATRFYLLNGLIRCPICNRPYIGCYHSGQNVVSYRHRVGEKHCQNKTLNGAKIEEAVWQTVYNALLNPEQIMEGYQALLDAQAKEGERDRLHLDTLKAALTKEQAKQSRLLDAYLDPDIAIDRAEFTVTKKAIAAKIADLEGEIARIETTIKPAAQINPADFAQQIADILGNVEFLTPEVKKEIMKRANITVYVNPQDDKAWIEGIIGKQELLTTICSYFSQYTFEPLKFRLEV